MSDVSANPRPLDQQLDSIARTAVLEMLDSKPVAEIAEGIKQQIRTLIEADADVFEEFLQPDSLPANLEKRLVNTLSAAVIAEKKGLSSDTSDSPLAVFSEYIEGILTQRVHATIIEKLSGLQQSGVDLTGRKSSATKPLSGVETNPLLRNPIDWSLFGSHIGTLLENISRFDKKYLQDTFGITDVATWGDLLALVSKEPAVLKIKRFGRGTLSNCKKILNEQAGTNLRV